MKLFLGILLLIPACAGTVEQERPPCDGYTFDEVQYQPACELGKSKACTFHFPHPEGPDAVTFTCTAICTGDGKCNGAQFESD